MKQVYLYIMLVFALMACNKDIIEVSEETTTTPPTEVTGPYVEGIIKNIDGKPVHEVSIDIYQNNSKIGSTRTDKHGKYHTIGTEIKDGIPVTLKYKKDAFNTSFRRMTFKDEKVLKKNVWIAPKDSFGTGSNVSETTEIETPDSNYVKVYGYLKTADGEPIVGATCNAMNRFWEHADFFRLYASTISDEEGYVEILVEKNKPVHLDVSYHMFPQSGSITSFTIGCVYTLHDYLQPIGPFVEEQEINFENNTIIEKTTKTFTGKAVRCDGTTVKNGILRLAYYLDNGIMLGLEYVDSTYQFGPNGEFEITHSTCNFYLNGDNLYATKASIVIDDNDLPTFSDRKYIELANTTDFENVELCHDLKDYPFTLDLTLGDEVIDNFKSGTESHLSGKDNIKIYTGTYAGEESTFMLVRMYDIKVGETAIDKFLLHRARLIDGKYTVYETTFDAAPADVTCTISKIEDGYVYGQIEGRVDTPDGKKPVHLDFKIYDK